MEKRFRRWGFYLALFAGLLAAAAVGSIFVGSAEISIFEVIRALTAGADSMQKEIILNVRLPRILMGIAIGGSLSVSGVLLQGMFKNPLVEPYTLGISGGAGLGVCLCLLFKFGGVLGAVVYPVGGFLGAAVALMLVYSLSVKNGGMRMSDMLLNGVMVSFITSSVIMLVMAVSRTEDLHGIIFWIMGSLGQPSWPLIFAAFAVSLAGLVLSYKYWAVLNAFSLGEKEAYHLGIDTEKAKRNLFLLSFVLAGVSVSVAGIIGFVGLVVPHFVRMIAGRDHRILILSSFLCGAFFLIVCDMLARTLIAPLELPVGVITGVIGGALFIYMLGRKGFSGK